MSHLEYAVETYTLIHAGRQEGVSMKGGALYRVHRAVVGAVGKRHRGTQRDGWHYMTW